MKQAPSIDINVIFSKEVEGERKYFYYDESLNINIEISKKLFFETIEKYFMNPGTLNCLLSEALMAVN